MAALALGLGGCAGDQGIAGGGRVHGKTLTVYSVEPNPVAPPTLDSVRGEQLALADAKGRVGSFAVTFVSLDSGRGNPVQAAEAVRRAVSDPKIIAAIAVATRVTVPLMNEAGTLQVAVSGDDALGTQPRLTPSGHPTLAPVRGAAGPPPGFDRRFRAAYGHAPTAAALRGYRAMRAILDAVRRAGRHGNDRRAVIDAYGV